MAEQEGNELHHALESILASDESKEAIEAFKNMWKGLTFINHLLEIQPELKEILIKRGKSAIIFIKEDGSGLGVMEHE